LLLAILTVGSAFGQTTIISDNYNITKNGTGFALDEGVNTGIIPPNTNRMTGTVAANLRYLQTVVNKDPSQYDIVSSARLRVVKDPSGSADIGRFTLSADGSSPFDFSSALGALYATPANPATYDVHISMRNDATGTARFSFGFATAEGNVTTWDFGIQLYRASSGDDFYTVQRRIDDGSSGAGDVNQPMLTMAAGTGGTMIDFLMRVTDAGAESGSDYHSRVQVSIDGGSTWFYDTSTDTTYLPNGWRFDGPGRYMIFDQAGNTSGNVFYDDFSIISTYAPPPPPDRIWTGGGGDDYWSTPANWGGTAPVNGDPLVFNGTTRQSNINDISGLTVSSLTFNNGGFTLSGNLFTNTLAIGNLAGINVLAADMAWDNTGVKNWTIASGSELVLNNINTVEINGEHRLEGGGALRLTGAMNIGQIGTANPPFIINDGVQIVDGGSFTSRGGYRIGSVPTAASGAQTVLTNGAAFTLTVSGANLRVGDSANPITSRLVINNSTLTMSGADLGIPYAAGATGEVAQVGGTVTGSRVRFSDSGAGMGTYTIQSGTLETYQIAEGNSGGESRIYFDNAVVRALFDATNDFMSGLDYAEIQSGGLTIDAQDEIVIAQNLTGAGSLTNSGYSPVTLSGANTYSGDTVVTAGKLVLPTGRSYPGRVQVADYAELGVLVQSSGQSLTCGDVNLGSQYFSTVTFDLGSYSNPTAPLMTVTNLTATGVVSVNIANGVLLTTGQFVLIDYQGSIGGGGFDAFVKANLPAGVSAELVNNTANSSIDLNITGVPGFLWTGAVNSSWDYSTQNWLNQQTASASTYSDGSPTEFRDGATTGIVSLAGVYPMPSLIIVSNDTLPYVWSGGAITTSLLQKNGSGSLTRIDGGADFIDEIELNAGAYVYSNLYDETFASLLTDTSAGDGTFVKRGSGMLTVSTANSSYEGTSVIQDGILKLGQTRSLGATTATIVITNGGTLELNDHQPAQPVIVSGAGVGGQGAIIDSTTSGAVEANLQDVTMTGHTTFGCPNDGRWDLRVRSSTGPGPGLQGNGFNLTKVGSGLVSIACQRNLGAETPYWQMDLGDILVSEGNLAFAESLDLGNPTASLTVSPGAILQLYDLGITNPIHRIITMTDARLNASGTSSHTNVINGGFLLTGSNTFWCDEAHLIVNGAMVGSGSLGLFANNPGTLLLNGVNTYTGDIIVTNGTLGGFGVIAGNLVMLDGTNSPGMSVGTLTVNGNATLAGTTLMELDRSLLPNSDRLVVGGTLVFGGILQVILGPGAPEPQAGDTYQLFNKGSGTAFSAINLPDLSGLPGDLAWDTSLLAVNGTLSVTGTAVPPAIGSVSGTGGAFAFSGTGGIENETYYVVTSPNADAPLPTWVPVETNVFGPGGSFNFTTNIVGGAPKAFFRLLVP